MREMMWCHEMIDPLLYHCPVFLSNFFDLSLTAFELSVSALLCANADSDCFWFVVQNWRIPPQNGNLLLRIEDLNGIIILSLPNALLEGSVLIIYSDSWVFRLIISPLVPLRPSASSEFLHSLIPSHYTCCCPKHSSRRRSLLMLVLSHSDTHHLNRHMAWCGCHERSNQSRSSQGYTAWCGCHEILIPLPLTVLFSTTFLLISISRVEGEERVGSFR